MKKYFISHLIGTVLYIIGALFYISSLTSHLSDNPTQVVSRVAVTLYAAACAGYMIFNLISVIRSRCNPIHIILSNIFAFTVPILHRVSSMTTIVSDYILMSRLGLVGTPLSKWLSPYNFLIYGIAVIIVTNIIMLIKNPNGLFDKHKNNQTLFIWLALVALICVCLILPPRIPSFVFLSAAFLIAFLPAVRNNNDNKSLIYSSVAVVLTFAAVGYTFKYTFDFLIPLLCGFVMQLTPSLIPALAVSTLYNLIKAIALFAIAAFIFAKLTKTKITIKPTFFIILAIYAATDFTVNYLFIGNSSSILHSSAQLTIINVIGTITIFLLSLTAVKEPKEK